jgi:hypothetical protein
LYLSKLDDAIRGYKARNHKAKNYNQHLQLESDQNERRIENACEKDKLDEWMFKEQKKMQDVARELAHQREKKDKILASIAKLKEKESYYKKIETKHRSEIAKIREEAYSLGINLNKKFKERVDFCFSEMERAQKQFRVLKDKFKTQSEVYNNDIEESRQTNLRMLDLLESAEEQINKQDEIMGYMEHNDPDCAERIQEWAQRADFYTWDRDYQKSNEDEPERDEYDGRDETILRSGGAISARNGSVSRSRSKSPMRSPERAQARLDRSGVRPGRSREVSAEDRGGGGKSVERSRHQMNVDIREKQNHGYN